MPLTPGTRLGPYEILSPLGAGGMGEVYRGKDTRLGRDVAVKVLPQHLSSNSEVRARFEREAKTVSSLNHPHICVLYDVGREGSTDYLVMELVEGETLADRIARGPLPAGDVLRTGAQIADALDRAHRAGVVHRDLKPGNIMLTRSGAKLMDFGLARATGLGGMESSASALTHSPTVAQPLTAEGTIVGTFQYMAPEQLEGRETDARSDIWALGCVIYEMATGKRAFEGATQASLISSIMRDEPRAMSELSPMSPPALERLVRQCIAKDPDDRWQTAGDLRRELEWIASGSGAVSSAGAGGSARPRRARRAWIAAGLIGVLAGAFTVMLLRPGRTSNTMPEFMPCTYRPMTVFNAAFAPDGKTIVFSAALEGNVPHLFVIRPENPDPQPFGDPGTHLLAVSSTGELAVLTGARYVSQRLCLGTLARMPVGGGAAREVLEGVREADWSPDGSQLAIIHEVNGRDRLEFPIGKVLVEGDGYLSDLHVSPRGDRIAYMEHPSRYDDRGGIQVVDMNGKPTTLADGYSGEEGLAWSPDGGDVLYSASMLGSSWSVMGVSAGEKPRVVLSGAGSLVIYDVNARGEWLLARDDVSWHSMVHTPAWDGDRDLSWMGGSLFPILSRDGSAMLFTEQGPAIAGNNYAVCLRKISSGAVVQLGEGIGWDLSPDGKRALVMISSPPGISIYPTGAGTPLKLERGQIENYGLHGEWYPGGDSILFWANEPGHASRYYMQAVSGGPPRAVTPEGTRRGAMARSGEFIIAHSTDAPWTLYPLRGGAARPLPALHDDEEPVGITADDRAVFMYRPGGIPLRVERVDLASGRRTLYREMAPADRAGVKEIAPKYISDDERSYTYWTWMHLSTLFTVSWK
jgi:eukaryotic-like serine/threonine-protein kinase